MTTIKDLEEVLDNFKNGTLKRNKNKLDDLKSKRILLYGAGNIGKRLYKILKDDNIHMECFIDRNRKLDKSKYEIPVYHPESNELVKFKENGYVIISALFSLNLCNEIKEQLFQIGFRNVFSLNEVNLSKINSKAFYKNLFGSYNKIDVTGKDRDNVLKAFSLFETEKDKRLYIEHLKANLTMDFTRLKDPYDVNLQYIAHDINEKKDYSNVIDCGGYNGDTIRNFVSKGMKINNIAVFEPQNDLNKKISEYIHSNCDKFKSAVIFPCGVYSKTCKLKFKKSKDSPSSSKLDENGDDIIQCTSIDNALDGFNPTFIKMDIEGSEIEALKGAKNTIIKNHPELAICVYHSLSHLWRIPLLIKSFYSGYKFYLRSYNFMGLETVLYAFPKE